MSIEKVKRVCLVTDAGRIYDEMDLADVKIAIQDNGITLKIFTSKDDKLTFASDDIAIMKSSSQIITQRMSELDLPHSYKVTGEEVMIFWNVHKASLQLKIKPASSLYFWCFESLPEDSQNDLSRTGRNIDNDTDFFSLFDRFDLKNPTTMIAWKQIKDDVIYHFTKIITKNAL